MSGTLLLVEDSPDDVVFVRRALAKAGVRTELRAVDDGQEAIDYLTGTNEYAVRREHPLPQLILLDLKLPLVSGFEVLRWIRAQPELVGVVVVVLTSSDHPSDIRESYALGANLYLSKPANPSDLTALMRDVANRWFPQDVAARTAQPERVAP